MQGSRLAAAMQLRIVRGLLSKPGLLTSVAETLTHPRRTRARKNTNVAVRSSGRALIPWCSGPNDYGDRCDVRAGSVTDVTFPNALGYARSKLQRAKAGAANEP